jgi:hypothetical protein
MLNGILAGRDSDTRSSTTGAACREPIVCCVTGERRSYAPCKKKGGGEFNKMHDGYQLDRKVLYFDEIDGLDGSLRKVTRRNETILKTGDEEIYTRA